MERNKDTFRALLAKPPRQDWIFALISKEDKERTYQGYCDDPKWSIENDLGQPLDSQGLTALENMENIESESVADSSISRFHFDDFWSIFQDGRQKAFLSRDRFSVHAHTGAVAGLGEDIPGFQLHPQQRESLGRLLDILDHYPGGVLGDEAGSGKTIVAIATIIEHGSKMLAKHGRKQPVLLVVPTSLVNQWVARIQKFAPSMTIAIVHAKHGKLTMTKEELVSRDVVVTTYETLRSEWARLKETQVAQLRDTRLDCLLYGVDWSITFFDEAHCLKNRNTDRVRSVQDLVTTKRGCHA